MKIGKLRRKRNFMFKAPSEVRTILDEMKYPKYVVKSPLNNFKVLVVGNEMRDWCTEQFGENSWYTYGDTIWFSNEKQLMSFMLRWSE